MGYYFSHQHFIPVDRVCQIFEDVFGIAISPGTCFNVDEKLFRQLESFESSLKTYLLAAKVLHFDETGMRCEKKLRWVHVASSQLATFYTIHAKRGQEAMNEAGISGSFRTLNGGQIFCRIRSYISTARKQCWNIWDALAEAVRACPRLLPVHQEAVLQAIAV